MPFTDATANVARRELLAQLEPLGVPRACVEDAVTILHELVRNGLDHGRPCVADTLTVAWDLAGDELTLAVTDCGTATSAEQPWRVKQLTPVQPDALRGRGLHLVAALSHDWHVRTTPADTTVTACVRVSHGA
ncbi:ATP-binding protein [Nocardioides zeae]|uniref:ATP-binding protein n=1 Tax=Nocardioides imazamoxiresistens TaxID=3231893 RepID=A0ABU3PZK1_9ACTN|nr:ATP-binding protein [Nocardioides zeae]MDT9594222.1 ATP-binding protein [Nocardioides zeae]